jgi:hypothetical protein
VFSLALDAAEVDAFSMWRQSTPYVFLNTKKSAEHGRFDAAHELGHLVLHRHGSPRVRADQGRSVPDQERAGLYVSYLAACEMNEAFSEYVLYEPILRILMARGFSVECEVECPGIGHAPVGDKRRLDFVARNNEIEFALEVRWINDFRMSVTRDVEKLRAYVRERPDSLGLIGLFGKQSVID